MNPTFVLYGTPGSLYTAKVRAYLRKQRIPFEERAAGDPRFANEVLPQIGRWIIPVLQKPEGMLVQDGAVIIDELEAGARSGPSAYPKDPLLRVIAHLFELFGGEGLLRPAMHYRWNFDDDNLAFIKADFIAGLAPGRSPEEQEGAFALASGRMRKATTAFGVTAQNTGLVEAAYLDFLARFDAHLRATPYLLGSTPTLGDYGMIGPLFAHLGRDPRPASLMKRVAPRVWRWVERMNAPDEDAPEYLGQAPAWIDPLASGSTLEQLMRFVAEDYLPEIEAHVAFANQWLTAHPELQAGTNGLPKPGERSIGRTRVAWRSQEIEVAVMPYRLFLLQRLQDAAAALDAEQGMALRALFARTGLEPLLELRCRRRVLRQGHLEVWGEDEGALCKAYRRDG